MPSALPTLDERASGILLHPTSLPGPSPIGDLGPEAFAFVDFLARAGQRWWQMLPVGPIGPGNSPYQSSSAFAGSPLLVSLEPFVQKGWLERREISFSRNAGDKVDFAAAQQFKEPLLRLAFEAFEREKSSLDHKHFAAFCRKEREWLHDFALFSALVEAQPDLEWTSWEPELRSHKPAAIRKAIQSHKESIRYHCFVQWQFAEQWKALKVYGAKRGVGFIGDLPIFVAHQSADVWANQKLFQLHKNGLSKVVAGVPPDYFSKTGQRWGNPHYRWDILRRDRYRWWIQRLRMMLRYFDAVRIDHFIGFVRYYEIPGEAPTAEKGRYRPGPGAHFFKELKRVLGTEALIAEDLGTVTPEVKKLRDAFNLPGMKVLQFAFGNDPEALNYEPHNFPRRSVVYPGTHDNDTTVGWFRSLGEKERRSTLTYLESVGREIHWDMIHAAEASVSNTAIIPMQDVLGLGTEARMNRPGVAENNWTWRLRAGAITPEMERHLRQLAVTYERIKLKT